MSINTNPKYWECYNELPCYKENYLKPFKTWGGNRWSSYTRDIAPFGFNTTEVAEFIFFCFNLNLALKGVHASFKPYYTYSLNFIRWFNYDLTGVYLYPIQLFGKGKNLKPIRYILDTPFLEPGLSEILLDTREKGMSSLFDLIRIISGDGRFKEINVAEFCEAIFADDEPFSLDENSLSFQYKTVLSNG